MPMDGFSLHRNVEEITILKNGEIHWRVKLGLSINTFSFTAKSIGEIEYELQGEGFFWWRKQTLLENNEIVDEFNITHSLIKKYRIDRRFEFYKDEEKIGYLEHLREKSEHGYRIFNWYIEPGEFDPSIYSILIMKVQGASNNVAAASI